MKKTSMITAMLTGLWMAPVSAATWTGTGEIRSMDNKVLKTYKVEVVRETKAPGTLQQNVVITGADGAKIWEDQCELVGNQAEHWKKTCSNSQGGGYMMNHGIGMDYVVDAQGRAYATTIIVDGPNALRLQRVELLNGKAQRIFVESLHK